MRPHAAENGIRRLFPPAVETGEADPRVDDGILHEAERALLGRVTRRRRREFTAGRQLARSALVRLGRRPSPILMNDDGAPLWPPGVVGAITHTRDYCGVAVARRESIIAVGLDAEAASGFPADDWLAVLTPGERRWICRHPRVQQETLAKLLFSAKECAYKCQYTVGRRRLGFLDVEVCFDLEHGSFVTEFLVAAAPELPRGSRLAGQFQIVGGTVMTGMVLSESRDRDDTATTGHARARR